jgi:hypothetical protein
LIQKRGYNEILTGIDGVICKVKKEMVPTTVYEEMQEASYMSKPFITDHVLPFFLTVLYGAVVHFFLADDDLQQRE